MTTKSAILRENAANCAELAAAVEKEPAKNRYKRMQAAWLALAEEQDWLDGHVPPVPTTVTGRVSNCTVGKAISVRRRPPHHRCARVILEIERLRGEYLEPTPPNGVQDAKATSSKS